MQKKNNIKSILLILFLLTLGPVYGQNDKQLNFIGLNPSLTVEPYYNSGELDINILPLVYQRTLSKRVDIRLTSILNYGIREGNDRFSHFGIETGLPIFFKEKEEKTDISNGFFIAPILSLTRNNEVNHTNFGAWIEPGYSLLFENRVAMSFGLQIGGTYFIYDNSTTTWGNHFGVKVIIGRWM